MTPKDEALQKAAEAMDAAAEIQDELGKPGSVILVSAMISFSPHFLEGGLGAIWATRGAQDGSRATQKQPKRPPGKSKGKN